MLNFFRNIRRKLADENSFIKYSRYAIGEIVLVMVGILLALQVNSWNGKRINKNKEHRLLIEMNHNLKFDLEELNIVLETYKSSIKSINTVLNHLNNEAVNKDSLGFHYHWISGYRKFNSNSSAFNNLQSIGIDLIEVDSLRRQITDLYANRYPRLNHGPEIWEANFQNIHVYAQITAHIFHDVTDWRNTHALEIEKLKTNSQFKEILKLSIGQKTLLKFKLEELESKIVSLQESIEMELR